MVDMIASSPQGGLTSPTLIQAQQNDPRVALARMMMEKSNNDQTPLYSPYATLAKALTSGLAGYTNLSLGKEYAQRQQDLGELTGQALKAGQTGIQGWHNPDAGQTTQADGSPMPPPVPDIQAQAPGFGAVASTLAQSKDPAAQQIALQYGMQDMQTKQAAQLAFLQKLAEKGLTLGPNGQVMALPNYGQAEAANVGPVAQAQAAGTATGTNAANAQPGPGGQAAVITATTPAKAAEAAATAAATAPIDVKKAVDIAGQSEKAKLPYEVVSVHGVGAFPKSTVLGTAPSAAPKPPAVLSMDGYRSLSKGTQYTAPDGSIRVKQ